MLDPEYYNSLSEDMRKFAADQLSLWPLARDNYRALKQSDVRSLNVGGLEVKLMLIPSRAISTNAKTDAESLGRRPCFLCAANRPPQQRVQEFEGAKNKRYNIQVNPYPILPVHFVVPSLEHTPQSIWHRYVDMLRLAKRRPGFTIIYNGPHSGASAPDHFHFQAIPAGQLPLEVAVHTKANRHLLTNVSDAQLYEYQGYANGVFVIWGKTSKSMNRMFYRLLDCADVPEDDSEPRFNLYTTHIGGEYCTIVVMRTCHRSSHYFEKDSAKHLSMSPGCVDMGGIFVTIDPADFAKLDDAMLQDMVAQVTIPQAEHSRIVERLTRVQKQQEIEIARGRKLSFEILTDGAGCRQAVLKDHRIEYGGVLYDELYFEAKNPSTMFAQPSFTLLNVNRGNYAGALKIVAEHNSLVAINVIGTEDYIRAVAASEKRKAGIDLVQRLTQLRTTVLEGGRPLPYSGLVPQVGKDIDAALDISWGKVLDNSQKPGLLKRTGQRFRHIVTHYPLSMAVVALLLYLSFFNPNKHELPDVNITDKFVHALMYFGVTSAFWMEWIIAHRNRKASSLLGFVWCFVLPLILGGVIELGQEYLTTFRSGDWLDMAANCAGTVLATVFALFVMKPVIRNISNKK